MTDNLVAQLNLYLDHIRADYTAWKDRQDSTVTGIDREISERIKADMIQKFVNSVRVECGNKYYKIVADNSVHSFVVLVDTPKFPRGTILKAASWRAPATNFGRGNILTGDWARATWTGIL